VYRAGGEVEAAAQSHDHVAESVLIVVATLVALAGIGLGALVYRKPGLPGVLARGSGPLYPLVRNMYWVDELYALVILRPFYAVSRLCSGFDRWVVDGLVNAAGVTTDITGHVLKLFQTGLVRNYALMMLLGVVAIVCFLVFGGAG